MDIATLLAGLTAADKAAQASNPYAPFESAATGVGSALLSGAKNYSLGDNLVAGLVTGLAGGYAQHLGNDYVAEQNSLARSLLNDAIKGTSTTFAAPENMAPSVFSTVKDYGEAIKLGDAFQAVNEKRQSDLQTAAAIERARQLAPLDVATDIAKKKAEVQIAQEAYPGLAGVPVGLQDDVIKQRQQAQQQQSINTAIDKYFEDAKTIGTASALIPGTTGANDMAGIQVGLTNVLQAAQGREMNDSARKALQAALPDWNDTVAQIEAKKEKFKEMYKSIVPASSIPLGLTGNSGTLGAAAYTVDQAASAGYSAAEIQHLKEQGLVK